jgi:anthranilate synthase/aminodeoxychorismate synthase-like glutamine amidotransferase
LVLDNDDSFTFNLFQCLGVLGASPEVFTAGSGAPTSPRGYDLVVISPGPGTPEEATWATDLLTSSIGKVPVLGVCLGHQVIARTLGGVVTRAPEPRHGKVSAIRHDGKGVFEGLAPVFAAVRYHSLAVSDPGPGLEACAWSEDGVIQGVRHRTEQVHGVQFHPESIMTEVGMDLLANFLALA